MAAQLLERSIWARIKKLCATGRGHVAVAFLGTSGRKLLPLRAGSVLVVNASERVVKQGQTNPSELKKYVRARVAVHNAPDLHAKVFAFPDAAVVGSTNVSTLSSRYWQEAALLVQDRRVVKQAREFVLDLAGESLPLERLEQLEKLYRPPRGGPQAKPSKKKANGPERSRLWIVNTVYQVWTDEDDQAADRGRPSAEKRLADGEELDEFSWVGAEILRMRRGDQVVQVFRDGKKRHVCPVGTIVGLRAYRAGTRKSQCAIVFVATPVGRRSLALPKAKQRLGKEGAILGKGAAMRLVRDRATAQAIRQLWRPM